jgi:hypothetical protein
MQLMDRRVCFMRMKFVKQICLVVFILYIQIQTMSYEQVHQPHPKFVNS